MACNINSPSIYWPDPLSGIFNRHEIKDMKKPKTEAVLECFGTTVGGVVGFYLNSYIKTNAISKQNLKSITTPLGTAAGYVSTKTIICAAKYIKFFLHAYDFTCRKDW
ncbi:MAG: hypothetical protein AMS24_02980 [Chlamydiae bacterium SM23_39]|nr:MAG: hypothetical protein AMS24_02980 [Chlamydiae bacterium SM23_39]